MEYEKLDERYVQTRFGMLHLLASTGAGAPLIFLHGLGASTLVWKRLVACLPTRSSVYLIDLLGHGMSAAPRIEYGIGVQVEALMNVVQSEGTGAPVLVGHSYGGWVAARYAADVGACGGLVLIDSAGIRDADAGDAGAPSGNTNIERLVEMNNNKRYVIESIVRNRHAGRLGKEDLMRIGARTLIIWGEHDSVVGMECAHAYNSIPGSRLEVISGARHSPHYTHAGEVSGLIMGFVC